MRDFRTEKWHLDTHQTRCLNRSGLLWYTKAVVSDIVPITPIGAFNSRMDSPEWVHCGAGGYDASSYPATIQTREEYDRLTTGITFAETSKAPEPDWEPDWEDVAQQIAHVLNVNSVDSWLDVHDSALANKLVYSFLRSWGRYDDERQAALNPAFYYASGVMEENKHGFAGCWVKAKDFHALRDHFLDGGTVVTRTSWDEPGFWKMAFGGGE